MGALYFSAVPPWCIMTHHSGSAVFEIILLSVYTSTVYSVGGLVQSTLPSVCCALYGYIHRYGTAADNSGLKSPMNYGVRPNHRQWLGETIKRNSVHAPWVQKSSTVENRFGYGTVVAPPYLHPKLKRGRSAAGICFGWQDTAITFGSEVCAVHRC